MLKKLLITCTIFGTISNASFARRANTSRIIKRVKQVSPAARIHKRRSLRASSTSRATLSEYQRAEINESIAGLIVASQELKVLEDAFQGSIIEGSTIDVAAAQDLLDKIRQFQERLEGIQNLESVNTNENLSQLAGILNSQLNGMLDKAAADLEYAIQSGMVSAAPLGLLVVAGFEAIGGWGGVAALGTIAGAVYYEVVNSENANADNKLHEEQMELLQDQIDALEDDNEQLNEDIEKLEEEIESTDEETDKTWKEYDECIEEDEDEDSSETGEGTDGITAETDVHLGFIKKIQETFGKDFMQNFIDMQSFVEDFQSVTQGALKNDLKGFDSKSFASQMANAMESVKGYAIGAGSDYSYSVSGGGSFSVGSFSSALSAYSTWYTDDSANEEYESSSSVTEMYVGDEIIEKPRFDEISTKVHQARVAITIFKFVQAYK